MFRIVLAWEATKNWLSSSTSLTHHDLHLIIGVLLTLTFTRIMRLPLGSWLPLIIVLGLELVNEVSDFTRYYVSGWPWEPGPTLIDIYLTMLPSLAITLVARWDTLTFYRLRRRPHYHITIKTL